jgi:ribosomal protein L7/L12
MTTTRSFHCPTCGAPLAYSHNAAVIHCSYCKNAIVVPETLRGAAPVAKDAGQIQQEALDDIYLMVVNSKKLEAVKRLHQVFDLSLKEAKDAADAIERGETITPEMLVSSSRKAQTPVSENAFLDRDELLALIRQGQKIEAIRRIRKGTELGLKESKIIADALEQGDDMPLAAVQSARETGAADRTVEIGLNTATDEAVRKKAIAAGSAVAVGAGCGIPFLSIFILFLTAVPILLALSVGNGPLAPLANRINPNAFARITLNVEGEGIGPGQFSSPRAIAADREGNIFVADHGTGRVQSFDAQGNFRWVINLGKKVYITSAAVGTDQVLFVLAQGKIHRFEASTGKELGIYETSFMYYFDDIAVAPDGRIGLIYRGENILIMSADMEPLFEIQEAVSSITEDSELNCQIGIDPLGNIFVLGTFNKKVLKFSPTGKYLGQFGGMTDGDAGNGKFRAPGDLAVDMQGRVYISDMGGVQVFDNEGQFLTSFKLLPYVHALNFDQQNQMYVVSNKPQMARLQLLR